MPIEGMGLAAQALHTAEQIKKSSEPTAVKPLTDAAAPQQKLSASEFQSRLKLKDTPLDLAGDHQTLRQGFESAKKPGIPESLSYSPRFQTFLSKFFTQQQTDSDSSPDSPLVLQTQAQFLQGRSSSEQEI